MRPVHLLLILLILAALGSQLYVEYSWEYRDAPSNVRLAVLGGGVAMLLLALLLGPRLLRRGRGAVLLPLLVLLALVLPAVAYADWQHELRVPENGTRTLTFNGTGYYVIRWCFESGSEQNATSINASVTWLGTLYNVWRETNWHPCSYNRSFIIPAGAIVRFHASNAPAIVRYNIEHRDGYAFPFQLQIPGMTTRCINISSGEGRYQAHVYVKAYAPSSTMRLIGSEKSDWANVVPHYLHAKGENIQLCVRSVRPVGTPPIVIKGYAILEPLPPLPDTENATIIMPRGDASRHTLAWGLGLAGVLASVFLIALARR